MSIESIATTATPPTHLGMDFRTAWSRGHLDYEIEDVPGGSVLRQREVLLLRAPLAALGPFVDRRLRPRLLDRLADVRDAIREAPVHLVRRLALRADRLAASARTTAGHPTGDRPSFEPRERQRAALPST